MSQAGPVTVCILGRLIGAAIILGGVVAAVAVALLSSRYPRTDDAYVRANLIGIAPHVQGQLVQLNVVDNQQE
jgi:multidrug efflux system membrane fusion protein